MIFQVILPGKFSHFVVIGGGFDGGAGGVVVEDESGPGIVPNFFAAHFVERVHGLQVQVVDLGEIHIGGDDLAAFHRWDSGVSGQNLFNGVHIQRSFVLKLNIVYNIHF